MRPSLLMVQRPGHSADPLHTVATYGQQFLKPADMILIMKKYNISCPISNR